MINRLNYSGLQQYKINTVSIFLNCRFTANMLLS